MRLICLIAAGAILAGCSTVQPADGDDDLLDLLGGGRIRGAALESAIREAGNHPLGSEKNPVRVNMPPGQRAYLDRLRCSDGKAPEYERVGNFGFGVFGSIIDGYRVVCATGQPRESMIFMDMYHPDHTETAPPPGFTIFVPGERQRQAA